MKIGLLGFGVVGRGVYELTRGRDDMPVSYTHLRAHET